MLGIRNPIVWPTSPPAVALAVSLAGFLTLPGCLEDTYKEPIRIALMTPLNPPPEIPPVQFFRGVSESFINVANVAVAEINKNGGIDGHELMLSVRDTGQTFFGPPLVIPPIIEELDDIGVVGAVGPIISGSVAAAIDTARDRAFPVISPSSTAGSLAEVEDGGFVFRNAPNDNIQALVLQYYLTGGFHGQTIERVHVMYEFDGEGGYGDGLFKSIQEAMKTEGPGGEPIDNILSSVKFGKGGSGIEVTLDGGTPVIDSRTGQPLTKAYNIIDCMALQYNNCDCSMIFFDGSTDDDGNPVEPPYTCSEPNPGSQPVDPRPAHVVLVSLDDAITLVNAWALLKDAWDTDPDHKGELNPYDWEWFFTDGAKTGDFTAAAPEAILDMVGTAPTNPTSGDAFEELDDAFRRVYPDQDVSQLVFSAQVWDAVYLLAAGLVMQALDDSSDEFGGLELARNIRKISAGPGLIMHAGQWRDLLAAVRSGATVDFDGASGPSNFDDCGETVGPYEIWQVGVDAETQTTVFNRSRFFDAFEIVLQLQENEALINECPGSPLSQ